MRDFCKPLSEFQRNEFVEFAKTWPKIVNRFNCQGDCLHYVDGVLVSKTKQNGERIEYKKK